MSRNKNLAVSFFTTLLMIFGCNKDSDQLPAKYATLTVSSKLNGLDGIDFIFDQVKSAMGDTVLLSIRNNTATDIANMTYFAELSKAAPQNYSNSDLQPTLQLQHPIKAGNTLREVFTWIDKGINLDTKLINVGVISYDGPAPNTHPLKGVYNQLHVDFEQNSGVSIKSTNQARGYVLADGSGTFRMLAGNINYNILGKFDQIEDFAGMLYKDDSLITSVKLERLSSSIGIDVTTTPGSPRFRLHLDKPIDNNNYLYFKAY